MSDPDKAALPAPLTPPECDLSGLPWLPLDTIRLLDSDFFALSSGEEFKAAIALWCRCWRQRPGASLPNDDRVLAVLSGAGARWPKIKERALHGFILCSDSRLYHCIIASKALEAWRHRLAQRERAAKRWDSRGNAAAEPRQSQRTSPGNAVAMQGTRTISPPTPSARAAEKPRAEGGNARQALPVEEQRSRVRQLHEQAKRLAGDA